MDSKTSDNRKKTANRCLELLNQLKSGGESGVTLWNKEIGAIRNPTFIDFRNSDLGNVDISAAEFSVGLKFSKSNFTHAIMAKTLFQSADLRACDFRSANLNGAKLTNCNLSKSDFSASNCEHAVFSDCDLRKVNFHNANLCNASLANCLLQGANFTGAHLIETNFHQAEFDDHTKWPHGFLPVIGTLKYRGTGKDPLIAANVSSMAQED
jgi:uncharacterized protein YjbI with pentapeptide repeats